MSYACVQTFATRFLGYFKGSKMILRRLLKRSSTNVPSLNVITEAEDLLLALQTIISKSGQMLYIVLRVLWSNIAELGVH